MSALSKKVCNKFVFGLKPGSSVEIIFIFVVYSLVFVEWIPEPSSIAFLVFMVVYILAIIMWAYFVLISGISKFECLVLGLIPLLVVNLVVASINDIDFWGWARSAAPFLMLLFSLYVYRMLQRTNVSFVISHLMFSSFIWCVYILLAGGAELLSHLLQMKRATWVEPSYILPYPLLGLLLLAIFDWEKKYKFNFACIIFLVSIVFAGYKSHFAVVVVAMAVVFLKEGSVEKVLYGSVASIFLMSVFLYYPELYDYFALRLSSVGGEGDKLRLEEINNGLSIFYDHPLFGAGLGVDFDIEYFTGKNFVHNSVVYFFATIGAVGVAYLMLLLYVGVGFRSAVSRNFTIVIVLLLVSTLTAASFKLLHFNFWIACIVPCAFHSLRYRQV